MMLMIDHAVIDWSWC